MHGDHLIIADDAQRKAEARAADPPADQINDGGQGEELPEEHLLAPVDINVEPAHGAKYVLQPGDDLPNQLRQAQRKDHEIDAANAQGGEADDRGKQRARDAGQ